MWHWRPGQWALLLLPGPSASCAPTLAPAVSSILLVSGNLQASPSTLQSLGWSRPLLDEPRLVQTPPCLLPAFPDSPPLPPSPRAPHELLSLQDQLQQKIMCPGPVTCLTTSPNGLYVLAGIAESIYLWEVRGGVKPG